MGTNARAALIFPLVAMLLCWPMATALAQEQEAADDEAKPAEAQSGSNGLKIGVVNLNKIQQQYGELQARQDDLQAWADQRAARLGELPNFLFLSAENFEEIAAILVKPNLSEEDKKRLEELRGVSQEKEKRFLALQSNPQRTPQEGDEYNSLLESSNMREVRLADLDNQFKVEFAVKRGEAIDSLMAKVSEAITAEAKAQKLNIVFDADVVLFADTDITDAVIKRLNAGQAEADDGQEGGGDQGGQ